MQNIRRYCEAGRHHDHGHNHRPHARRPRRTQPKAQLCPNLQRGGIPSLLSSRMNTGACGSALPLHNRGPPVLHAVLPGLISLPSTKVHVWTWPTCGRTAYRGALGELSRLRPDVNVDDQPGHLTVPSFALRTQEVRKPQHQRATALTYENAAHPSASALARPPVKAPARAKQLWRRHPR